MLKISAVKRDDSQKLGGIKAKGFLPAVFYGKKTKSTPISISNKDLLKILRESGESSMVEIDLNGKSVKTLIKDIDRDPVSNIPRHADFYVLEEGQKVKIKIPIEFIGEAPAVKDLGATVVKVLHEIEIEALPENLPNKIEVSVESLKELNSRITAGDVKIPANIVLITPVEEIVASVAAQRADEPVEEAPVDLSAIEVVKKGKEVKEGEEVEGEASKQTETKESKPEKK